MLIRFVQEYIHKYRMISPGDHIIAGVSGGADSMCLLDILNTLQSEMHFSLTVVHVEHGLRGAESLADADFVKQFCEERKILCRIISVDVETEKRRSGASTEEAARSLRYAAFEQIRQQEGGTKVATAHHQLDQAETLLLNLARGSGLRGMGGIYPVRGRIIRPLLDVDREQIIAYLKEKQLTWVTDQSNASDDYTRNRIRRHVLPYFTENINKQATAHLAAACVQAREAEEFLEEMASEKLLAAKADEKGIHIPVESLSEQKEILQQYMIRQALRSLKGGNGLKDLGMIHIRQIQALLTMPAGKKRHLPDGLRAEREKDAICLFVVSDEVKRREAEGCSGTKEDRKPDFAVWLDQDAGRIAVEGGHIEYEFVSRDKIPAEIPNNDCSKWLSYDTMCDSICLRTRRPGDYLVISGTGGRKKLKDHLIDQKIPRAKRDRILVAAQGSHVLWMLGGRISEAAKVGAHTAKALHISFIAERKS